MIVLASQSPRRQELLRQIGCRFRVEASRVEELSGDEAPDTVVVENARRKAIDVAERTCRKLPVLGADTVVDVDGEILGKPRYFADAIEMLCRLNGREHVVRTGIALVTKEGVFVDRAVTSVAFAQMTNDEIFRYVATGEPMDKAGAYGIQGIAARYIERIAGSYSNVVGLPLRLVCELAERNGVDLFS